MSAGPLIEWVVGIIGLAAFVLFIVVMGRFLWSKSREWETRDK